MTLLRHPLTWIVGGLGSAVISGSSEGVTEDTRTDTQKENKQPRLFVDANIAIAVGKVLTDPASLNSNESARVTTVLAMGKQLTVKPTVAVETRNNVLPVTTIQAGALAELPKVVVKMAPANVGNGNVKDQTIVAEVVLSVPVGGTVEFATADRGIYNKLHLMGVGNPAKAQGANRLPFVVGIEGRTLRVIPIAQ